MQSSPPPPYRPTRSRSRRRAPKGKSKLLKVFIGFVAVFVLLLVAALIYLNTLISEDSLEAQLERAINSEVEIGDVDISLLGYPTRLTLSDVVLSPKEGDDPSSSVKIDTLELDVGLWELMKHHIDISKITIKRAEITSTYFEDGSTSLGEMFRSPKKDKKRRGSSGSSERDADEGGFNIFDQEEFVASLGGLVIEDSRVDITLEKTGLRIRCDDVHLELSSMRIDPNNLKDTNTAKVTLSSMVKLHSTKGWHYGDLDVSGDATARIFNPETGNTEPDVEGHIDLAESSWLNTRIPVITSAWQTLSILEKVGINVAKLPEKATFGRSEAVAAHYHLGKITVREPLSIWVGDWELAAMDGSWLQTETDQHEINAELLASVKSSENFLKVIRTVVKLVPEKVADLLVKDVEEKLFRDDRLLVKVRSTGDFSDPKIRPVEGVPDLFEEAKKAGTDALKNKAEDLLRGLLGGDDE
ncbi:AsmA family protein [Oceaniferula spumae]